MAYVGEEVGTAETLTTEQVLPALPSPEVRHPLSMRVVWLVV